MKKMLMILMMVFGLSVVFADSFIAITDRQSADAYENDEKLRAEVNDAVKEIFKDRISEGKYSKQEQKRFTLIVVSDTDFLYEVWVYTAESKVFGIGISDADGNPVGSYHYESSSKTDPVLVGLNFIKEIVLQVNNVDKGKVVFTSFEVQDQNQ